MIAQKLLEPFKQEKDDSLNDYINISYSIYNKEIIAQNQLNKVSKKFDNKLISNLIRIFRMTNHVNVLDEDYLKDVFKGKDTSMSNFLSKIKEINSSLGVKLSFLDKSSSLLNKNLFCYDNQTKNILGLVKFNQLENITWKVELVISNSTSNRVLVPLIYFNFHFADGTVLNTRISVKVFQELRKSISFHIKRILENEKVGLIK